MEVDLPPLFDRLESFIRCGKQPDSPKILRFYFEIGIAHGRTIGEDAQRDLYKRMFTTFLETLCDTSVAEHWRWQCLDYAPRPLCVLATIARSADDNDQIRTMRYELRVLSHHFLPTKSAVSN